MKKVRLFLFLVIILLLSSCSQNQLDNDNFLGFKVGNSTKEKVIEKLGKPLKTDVNGMITSLYYNRGMKLVFDTSNDKLIGYNISSSFKTSQSLKIGDSIDKMFEIYGKKNPIENEQKVDDKPKSDNENKDSSKIDWDKVKSFDSYLDNLRALGYKKYLYENEKSKLIIIIENNKVIAINYARKDLYPL